MNAPTTADSPPPRNVSLSSESPDARPAGAWLAAPRWGKRLRADQWPDLFDPAGVAGATLVKANPNRQVWRVQLGDERFYVKLFRPAGWTHRLRGMVRKPEALREWLVGRYAESAGVPCVGFVACGLRRRSWFALRNWGAAPSVLITEAAEGTTLLPEAWRRVQQIDRPGERRRAAWRLANAVATLLATAHDARVLHRDGHPGNILVGGDDTVSPKALYVDLYEATIGKAVSDRKAAKALAQLDQWFRRHAARPPRLRFLKDYLTRRFGTEVATGRNLRHWAAAVARAGRSHAATLVAQRDRRIWRRGKYFATLATGGEWRATVALSFRNRDEFPQPIHPDRPADEWGSVLEGHLRHPDESARGGPPSTAVERWRAGGVGERLAWMLWGSPARRAFAIGHGLRHRDVPGVWPVALLERRAGAGVFECHLLTEQRPHCCPLADLATGPGEWPVLWRDLAWRRAALESVGRLLADAALAGVRWAQPQAAAVAIEGGPQPSAKPRALFGRFEGIAFLRRPDLRQGALAVLSLARELAGHHGLDLAGASALLTAFRDRLGRAFRRPPGWPDEAMGQERQR